MKKFLSSFLLLILLSTSILSFGANEQYSSWAKDGIEYMLKNDFIPTNLQENYKSFITRLEFAQLVVQTVEKVIPDGSGMPTSSSNTFIDTKEKAALQAHAYLIMNGTSKNTFSPNNLVTREQISTMLFNLSITFNEMAWYQDNYTVFVNEPVTYADSSQISSWAVPYIAFSTHGKLMNGIGNNRFDPKGNVTREQAIVMLYNLISRRDVNAHIAKELKEQYKGRDFMNGYAYKLHIANAKPVEIELSDIGSWTRKDFENKFGYEFSKHNIYYYMDLGFKVEFRNDKVFYFELYYLDDVLPIKWTLNGTKELGTYYELEPKADFKESWNYYWKFPVTRILLNNNGKGFVYYNYKSHELDKAPLYLLMYFPQN